jgi:hypothetical protein
MILRRLPLGGDDLCPWPRNYLKPPDGIATGKRKGEQQQKGGRGTTIIHREDLLT